MWLCHLGFVAGRTNVTAPCPMPKACNVYGFTDWYKLGRVCVKYFHGPLNFTDAEVVFFFNAMWKEINVMCVVIKCSSLFISSSAVGPKPLVHTWCQCIIKIIMITYSALWKNSTQITCASGLELLNFLR